MRLLSSKIVLVDKKEMEEVLNSHSHILSCQCKGGYPDELKAWIKREIELARNKGNLMRVDELRRGKISKPGIETVKILLQNNKLLQVELVVRDKDFGILEKGYTGDVTYIVKYDEK
jgi:hypothetical protein